MGMLIGKKFIIAVLVLGLAVGGFTWLSRGDSDTNSAPTVAAQTTGATQSDTTQRNLDQQATPTDQPQSSFQDGYRAGYRDAVADLSASSTTASTTVSRTTYRRPRTRVAGVRYERSRGHSTRDLILTIAGPAAVGAGVGAIAGGKRGAGAGALIGGGGGAIYHLIRNRRSRTP